LETHNWIGAIVIKPSLIGSVSDALTYINKANHLNIPCILSDTFHSGIGLSFLLRLSAASALMIPMGFDTYSYLREDVLKDRLFFGGGSFRLKESALTENQIDFSRLLEFRDDES